MTTDSTAFATLPLSAAMLANLDALGYTSMTPIQAQSLPVILKGQDLIAQAKTGSGKTAAFGIGLLNPINPRYFGCQALVLCPTRELADQVAKELRRLARAEDNIKILTLCGGVSLGPQIASLEHGAHIIVGTPGRIQQHLDKGTLVLGGLNTLILDEADRMLDMGFFDAIASIIAKTPARRQTLLFSATYPSSIKQLAADFMRDPQQVRVESLHTDNQIEQRFIEIAPEQRLEAVTRVLAHYRPQSCVAFCFTKQQCEDVVAHLTAKGIVAQALHGDLEQRDRDQVLTMFANRSSSVLVATDVAARGLDIDGLDMVINVELARDAEIHVHRVGRTGRAGEKGIAVSLVAPAEGHRAQAIEALQKSPLRWDLLDSLKNKGGEPLLPVMSTLCIAAGRKDKLRPGDILGALTGDAGIPGKQVGKIAIFDFQAFVAVERALAKQAMQRLNSGKIKGRSLKVRIV
ncbi:UNVERIFIED_ORG: ATP-independent RNA helicase DbpA [Pseudomonas parafulva]|uniref:ATP-dependent RNA helicase DbpA n=4 Tax=Pseudomonas TaxID=286 RepID=A0A2L1W939_9PSED|nr:ATP-dependent RNA helicase DbpA [Pseudomonas fulva]MBH3362436.1 ATP-dependent RNA helicase DbpA [Pseudomonas sp. URMO17WK12:I11]MDP9556324.1 ATP-independent RNA helicase DbpA [Pseudomonas parafulva]MDP9663656.1 ATP-independent RNA helicase DbpA [Pseudomonas cremoricolorata]PZW56163.1 ATP-dependent RNA helicase DbpA [Pseudomonas sp. URIL14HWK12:I3]PZW57917.1 ATP-dependent RNA helicase DbpA [Pseudomonas sp. URIL14HWK12:I2]QDC06243.1 ATP-dependent RNA helicase DbpA [Pseudomonas sp. SWI7]RDL2